MSRCWEPERSPGEEVERGGVKVDVGKHWKVRVSREGWSRPWRRS